MNGVPQRRSPGERGRLLFRLVAAAALVSAFGQVALGGVVRVTGSGLGCPDWPLCHGRLVPPFELTTLIEYSHRLSASVLVVLVLGVAVLAWILYRSNRWIMVPSLLGLGLLVAAAVLGGVTVLTELDWRFVLAHLGIAELVVACMAIASVVAWRTDAQPRADEPESGASDRFSRLIVASVAGAFILILSGSYMVGYGAGSSCGTWPLCGGSVVPDGAPYAIHMGHRFVAAAVGLLIAVTVFSAWRRRTQRPEIAWAGLTLAVIFSSQVVVGAGTVWAGFSAQMKAVHLSLATLVWIAVVLLATLVFSAQRIELRRVAPRLGSASELGGFSP